ncbi:MAG TPA: flagellar basal-body rod protein FlgF [Phycisphaerae bacterium]|nr:flagellar basal-body rod protein FlgF [Phycisphaerae bacterium]
MIYGLWLSAAGLQANEHRQAVLANNLANAETTGFKQDLAVFRQRLTESQSSPAGMALAHPVLDGLTGGTFVRPTYTDFSQGTLDKTNSPLDVAIVGRGFFAVQDGDEVRYTRDGSFHVDAQGRLVTARGHLVLDESGAAISVPSGAKVSIGEGGRVLADDEQIGRLGLVDVSDPQRLVKVGQNLFDGQFVAEEPFAGQLEVGALEQSTVEPVTLLAHFIEAARAYQLNGQMITLQDGMLGRAVNDIAKL